MTRDDYRLSAFGLHLETVFNSDAGRPFSNVGRKNTGSAVEKETRLYRKRRRLGGGGD